ncbi:hypothetical protein V8C35DRAFT_309180 [Trichoderma chlorosporum]
MASSHFRSLGAVSGNPSQTSESRQSTVRTDETTPSQVVNNASQESQNAPGRLLSDKADGRSLREKFNVDTRTGGVSLSVPIQTSPGRSDFGPSLNLAYTSGSASNNGIFGLGWSLSGVDSISRKTSIMIPLYDDEQDTFVHSSIGDLVPVLDANSGKPIDRDDERNGVAYRVRTYRPRVESGLIRVERWICQDGSGKMHWKTIASGGITAIFGEDTESQISSHRKSKDSGDAEVVFEWLASELYDRSGNHMFFSYKSESSDDLAAAFDDSMRVYEDNRNATAQRYLKSIKYGNTKPNRDLKDWTKLLPAPQDDPWYWMFEVVFDYGDHPGESPTTKEAPSGWALRPDPFSSYNSGFEIRTYRRCQRVLMIHHFQELKMQDCLVAATEFNYDLDSKSGASVLRSCTPCGYQWDKSGTNLSCLRLPAVEFEYWTAPDINDLRVEELELNLAGLTTPMVQWVDLNGDGAPGILAHGPGVGWYYHQNDSHDTPGFTGPRLVSPIPNLTDTDDWSFEDMSGDGHLDIVLASSKKQINGFYEHKNGEEWVDFVPFNSFPSIDITTDPTVHKVDLSGDGHADLLQLQYQNDNEFIWYPSLGREGYGAACRTGGAPGLLSGESNLTVLCDMVGDGLSDIVSISNTSVRYWPNMGHGRFGHQVIMGNAPLLADGVSFSPQRIRMADITGTGTTDLVYLPPEGGAHIYYNQSGNFWSSVHVLGSFPVLDRLCAVDVLDIGARGTQCLCWTSDMLSGGPGSTTVRFLDLMGGNKPGLLKKCSNGIGGQTEMAYRSSTQYHMDDQRAGKNWKRRLPFPIHCVERVVTRDLIAQTTYNMRYVYHNGYYDPAERHFRGFQMVEQWDAEDLAASKGSKKKFQRPPVHTKTWYYLGLQQMDELTTPPECYVVNEPQQAPLSVPTIRGKASTDQCKLSAKELQDAYRALSGQKRRQEVFGADESFKSPIPYSVSQQTYEVVMHQGISRGQRYGIFRVQGREELICHYERDVGEALVQHSFTLQTDDYGNICKQAVVSYGKLQSKLEKDEDRKKQQETAISYVESDYTNAIDPTSPNFSGSFDYFQIPLPSETRQYHVLPGSEWISSSPNRYTWETLNASLPEIEEVPIHENPPGESAKGLGILVSKHRTLYSKADLTGPLPINELEPFSIGYQDYQLAFTNKFLELILKDDKNLLIPTENLAEELSKGGYVQLPELDGQKDKWWAPSSRKLFKESTSDDSPKSSLNTARSHFYISNAEISQFGHVSHQEMDQYQLLTAKSIDAVKNTTLYTNTYVHLKPNLVTNANDNRVQSVFDPFGRSLGLAIMGKQTEALGDSLDGFLVTPSQKQLEQFLNDPSGPIAAELLGNAGRRTIYHDQLQEGHEILPSFQAELVRDTHYKDDNGKLVSSQIFVSFDYFDGHGKVIQRVSLSGSNKDSEKWRLTGWTICDNKGQEVKQFLPSVAASHRFRPQADSSSAPSTTLLRDPLDRVAAMLNADHTWTKTQFTPWMQVDYNAGDTVQIENPAADSDVGNYFTMLDTDSYLPTWYRDPESSREAASKSEVYNNTPTTTHSDSLGRDIVVERDNGPVPNSSSTDMRITRKDYDLRGNLTKLRDALNRVVSVTKYDLLGHPLHRISMDSGNAWNLPNCLGSPFLSWTGRGYRHRNSYDAVGRLESVKVQLSSSAPEITVVKNIYGEGQPDSLKKNMNGQLYQTYDQSGLQTNNVFDFHGSCVEESVKYAVEYKKMLDWSNEGNNVLEDTEYKTKTSFNATGLVIHTEDSGGESIRRTYDVAGQLKTLKSFTKDGQTVTSSVDNVSYAEDGKITSIDYGNGSRTTHEYDPKMRRLIRTITKRNNDKISLEDVTYLYDCVGKVIKKTNIAEQTIYFNNSVVSPSQQYSYNALGQLMEATGREQVDASNGGQKRLRPYDATSSRTNTIPGDGRQMLEYIETYEYDLEGNIMKMRHAPRTATDYSGWTRTYQYDEPSCIDKSVKNNRLSSTAVGSVTESYQYDDDAGRNGCITSFPGYSALSWDHNDKLRSFATQKVSKEDATPETTWYIYNSRGTRTRKVTDGASIGGNASPAKRVKETRYLPMRDIFITYQGDGISVSNEITTTSVGDSSLSGAPVVMLEHNANTQEHVIRYQISPNLELDDTAQVLSYEEYAPYGSSTYQSRNKGIPRKYRFMSYEKDRESGFLACGARYYAPWLGRWTSPDPIGSEDGLSLYVYVGNDPVNFDDPQGTIKRSATGYEGSPPAKRPRLDLKRRATDHADAPPLTKRQRLDDEGNFRVMEHSQPEPASDQARAPVVPVVADDHMQAGPSGIQAAGNEASTSTNPATTPQVYDEFVSFPEKIKDANGKDQYRLVMNVFFPRVNGDPNIDGFMAHGLKGRLQTPETIPWDRNQETVIPRHATTVAKNIIHRKLGQAHGVEGRASRRGGEGVGKPFYLFACYGADAFSDNTQSAGQQVANMIQRPVFAYHGKMNPKGSFSEKPDRVYKKLQEPNGVDEVYDSSGWRTFYPQSMKK